MHAVISRIRLREPLDDATLATAQRDLDAQAATVPGLRAIHAFRGDDDELTLLILGDDEAALDRTREELGNTWMRTYVIPHAAGPPDRRVVEAVLSWERPDREV